jgi:RES domain-containing protein
MTGASASPDAATRQRLQGATQRINCDARCMGPATRSLEPHVLVTRDRNRWSDAGEPTIYLAGDPGVAIAEFGRHWSDDSVPAAMWTVRLRLDRAIDLRGPEVRQALGIPNDPTWMLDRDRCRSIARELRASGGCDGLIVPSAAFLDDDRRWNAVVFVDRLQGPLAGTLEVAGPSHVMTSMNGPG